MPPSSHLDSALAGRHVGGVERGAEQEFAAEDVERQVAVVAVETVEEAALLLAVHRIIGGVEVEDDLGRRRRVAVQEVLDQQALDAVALQTAATRTRARMAETDVAHPKPDEPRPSSERCHSAAMRTLATPGSSPAAVAETLALGTYSQVCDRPGGPPWVRRL